MKQLAQPACSTRDRANSAKTPQQSICAAPGGTRRRRVECSADFLHASPPHQELGSTRRLKHRTSPELLNAVATLAERADGHRGTRYDNSVHTLYRIATSVECMVRPGLRHVDMCGCAASCPQTPSHPTVNCRAVAPTGAHFQHRSRKARRERVGSHEQVLLLGDAIFEERAAARAI